MRTVFGSWRAQRPADGPLWFCQRLASWLAIVVGLAALIFHALASAQTAPPLSQNLHRKLTPLPAQVVDPSPKVDPPTASPAAAPPSPPAPAVALPVVKVAPIPAPPPTPEQMPPRPPEVSWDGKLLSINCENSTLADILAAVRARTGAAIEIPAGADAERVATSLGPASAREVLTSLLTSSDFDYVIQASDKNPALLGTVIITQRGKADDSILAGVAPSAQGIRRVPGYSASGRPAFETPREKVSENSSPSEATSASEAAQPSQDPGALGAEPVSAGLQQPVDANSQAVPPAPVPADSVGPLTGGNMASAVLLGALPASGVPASPPTSIPQMEEDLQRMYQQRRQIQVQQNQINPAPAN